MNLQFKNISTIFIAIFMVLAVLISTISASDVHAEELFSPQVDHVQVIELSQKSENTRAAEHNGGLCFHTSCHHNSSGIYQLAVMEKPKLHQSEIIKSYYITPPEFDLTAKLKRPPRA